MKTSHIVIGAFILWSAGLTNVCFAQAPATGTPSASVDSTQSQADFILVQHKSGLWFYGQVVEWNKNDLTLTLDTDSLGTLVLHKWHITRTVPGPIAANERSLITGDAATRSKSFRSSMWRRRLSAPNPNPQAGRYFFAPSAFQLKKGEVTGRSSFYTNDDILFANEIGVGLTDQWTIGTTVILPLGYGGGIKYGLELEPYVQIAAGGAFLLPFQSQRRRFYPFRNPIFPLRDEVHGLDKYGPTTLVFANFTLGSVHHNITLNWFKSQSVGFDVNVINVSALLPINERTWLITENYFADASGLVVRSLGVRRYSKWGFQYDFAIYDGKHPIRDWWTGPQVFLSATIPVKY